MSSPFEQVLDFIGDEFVPVTRGLLKEVNAFYVAEGVNLPTFGQVFESLKFLQSHGVLEIQEVSNGQYLIRSIYGKDYQ